jgi:hypothetical protein
VVSGDTAFVRNPSWKYARTLGLNTSATGAGIAAAVAHFPVLIRLNAANFNFSQANPHGGDLRFTKADNAPLPYEIERWDPAAGLAEVWVKIDTVFGNDSDQSITMYWGNPASSQRYASGSVFDTAYGFQGVWHLGDNADDSVRDATSNRYHGVSPDTARPSIAEGVIGNCRVFDGVGDYITMPNTTSGKLDFPQNGHYSVSAWVTADTFVELAQMVASKGKFQYILWLDSASWEFNEYQDKSGWDVTAQKANVKQWVLLTGVRDGASQYIYVNGEPADSIFDRPCTESENTASDFFIGRAHGRMALRNGKDDYYSFKGCIDEVRVYSAARSGDWIKLCYMNQRIDDRLVVFK